MSTALCALVLAAGEGRRLRPLTALAPKALCPVGNVALLDRALARLTHHGLSGPALVAVNACYMADRVAGHVGGRAFVSVELGPPALGTAGAVANLRDWIAGRGVLVGNADAYLSPAGPTTADLAPLLHDWDGSTVRILAAPVADEPVADEPVPDEPVPDEPVPDGPVPDGPVADGQTEDGHAEFDGMRFAGFSLLPWSVVEVLPEGRSELVRQVWRPAEAAGRLELVTYCGVYLDTGTPTRYLEANLHAAGGGSLVAPDAMVTGELDRAVIGTGAHVYGAVSRGVVWPGGFVGAGERLVDAIRAGRELTVDASYASHDLGPP